MKRNYSGSESYSHIRIKEWPLYERPREKLMKNGSAALSDAELLALLIGSGIRGITAVDMAKSLLLRFQEPAGIAAAGLPELRRLKGVGPAAAARIAAAFELGRRAAAGPSAAKTVVRTPADIMAVYGPGMAARKTEVFKVLLLDNANQVIKDEIITVGTLNASLVHPREVFKTAVDYRSAGVVLIHNHPSGNVSPSPEDRQVTTQMIKAGEIMGIPVIDHVIIAGNRYYSFAEDGRMH